MRRALPALLILAASAPVAVAQEGVRPPEPLSLVVRPSSVEETRAERLARRAQDLDFAFRSICRGCAHGREARDVFGSPFAPIDVLARPKRAAGAD